MSQVANSIYQRVTQRSFGQLSTGQATTLYTLTNRHGMQVSVTNYGAIVVSVFTPDRTGRMADVVLGYDCAADYEEDSYYLGAVVGRYAGRIENGVIEVEGQTHQLTLNAPDSQLHGGPNAFNKQLWQAKSNQNDCSSAVCFTLVSPDGDNGFPGDVTVKVLYTLTDDNELTVEYTGVTNKATLLNLTQHSYFNLAGHNSGNIHNHQVQINADSFLPMTERAYPTGQIKSVAGTVHDFTKLKTLAEDIDGDDEQIKIGLGYDNYWLTNTDALSGDTFSARVVDPDTGRSLTIYTDQPSIILYTANYIDGSHVGKNNFTYQQRAALCLEPQRANNREYGPSLANTLLTPQQSFYSKNRYCFGVV
ncbi:aldose epimerase family protein [Psychrobium sp. 1_MG-2023]|uniref:aldose epimerase family protein n=1 Tax=Psychrobium sp. 1_MG-2023 TaxID=3062624 RepID=UPI0026B6BED1|nr:aldose epimerase family protein [Psychrobium sp. 1_MG-2023]MDP2560503.1 aldose epimerase family protein [Psychrobium sp. 1_MG-2023]